MKRALRDAWIADLRANPDMQARSVLVKEGPDGDKHCCLGRLCLVEAQLSGRADPFDGEFEYETDNGDLEIDEARDGEELSKAYLNHVGLTREQHAHCIVLNDGKRVDGVHEVKPQSFTQIADWIEQNIIPED